MFENLPKLIEWLKRIWMPFAGFIDAITLTVQFIELWKGNQAVVTWVTAILSLIILLLLLTWVGFGKSENKLLTPIGYKHSSMRFPLLHKFARAGLLILTLLTAGAFFSLYNKPYDSNNKIIILVTNFDGADREKYRVTSSIWENFLSAFQKYDDVELILLENSSIKSTLDAKQEGEKYNATIIIWGWYATTDQTVRLSTHFDILKPSEIIPQNALSQDRMRDFQITELQEFEVQEKISNEMIFLSLTTIGAARYSLQDWDGVITYTTPALVYSENIEFTSEMLFLIGLREKAIDKVSSILKQSATPSPGYTLALRTAKDMPQDWIITGKDLSFIQVSNNDIMSVLFTNPEAAIGKYTKFSLEKGTVLTESLVSDTPGNIFLDPLWIITFDGRLHVVRPTCLMQAADLKNPNPNIVKYGAPTPCP